MFDAKRFGLWIAVLGLIVLLAGGVYYVANHDVKPKPVTGLMGIASAMDASDANMFRRDRRSSATRIMIGGGVIAILGIGLVASTRKQKQPPA